MGASAPPDDAADAFRLQRFVEAQDQLYEGVLDELRRGEKTSHWMWFVFPQLAGLGRSETARFFAIQDLAEARAYLRHPVLGTRLLECTRVACACSAGRTAERIFGQIDGMKFHSSMTLFAAAAGGRSQFHAALDRFFDGVGDPRTLDALA